MAVMQEDKMPIVRPSDVIAKHELHLHGLGRMIAKLMRFHCVATQAYSKSLPWQLQRHEQRQTCRRSFNL